MNYASITLLAVVLTMSLQFGCSVGQQTVLFVTKSNIGIDVDSKPPTAEISVARKEAVIEPTFEGGQTPPVIASFRSGSTGLLGLFFSVSSSFAGGDAAATMTRWFGADTKQPNDIESSRLCLTEAPTHDVFGREISMPDQKDVHPFVFGTDTALGLKMAWSGLTAQIPDTVRLGYNRKELAWAPVFVTKEPCRAGADTSEKPFAAYVTSFLATIEHDVKATEPQSSGYDHLQYFATGTAATNLALQKEVRKVLLKKINPEFTVVGTYEPDSNSRCIKEWLDSDRPNNVSRLKKWLADKQINAGITDLIYDKELADKRATAVKELGLTCK